MVTLSVPFDRLPVGNSQEVAAVIAALVDDSRLWAPFNNKDAFSLLLREEFQISEVEHLG